MKYLKSQKYADYNKIYENCAGPGGLKLAEFMAEKMSIEECKKMIDIGFYRGYQTCFLAKEYNVNIIAIDPGTTFFDRSIGIEPLMENARAFEVDDRITGVKTGVPNTLLPSQCFDYAYVTTCLEMIRGSEGNKGYLAALNEIFRVLKKGGVLGLAEPMCLDVPIPEEERSKNFVTLEETKKAILEAGFSILEADYSEDAKLWWYEYLKYDPGYGANPEQAEADFGRAIEHWLSYGYVIAVK